MKNLNLDTPLVLDVESTFIGKPGASFNPNNRLVSYAYLIPATGAHCFKYHSDPDFARVPESLETPTTIVVGFNIKFDLHWLSTLRNHQAGCQIWDCQLAEHILTGQRSPYISLNEALESYGLPVKLDVVKGYWDAGIDTDQIPVEVLEEYNKHDVMMTYELYKMQRSIMTPEQINLLLIEGEDMKTLIECERNGIKWDAENADKQKHALGESLSVLNSKLRDFLPFGADRLYSFNWNSGDQLSALLYGGTITYDYAISEEAVYQSGARKGQSYTRNRWFTEEVRFPARFRPLDGTEIKKTKNDPNATTHFYQVDEPTLLQLKTRRREDNELLSLLRERAEKIKVLEMIASIEATMAKNNWQDNIIHGQYNQNVAVTGRLSSSAPNMQNTPPEVDQLLVSRYDD